jgi:hypothetical protein
MREGCRVGIQWQVAPSMVIACITPLSTPSARLDHISDLRDPSMFRSYIEAELKALRPQNATHLPPEPLRIAESIATR